MYLVHLTFKRVCEFAIAQQIEVVYVIPTTKSMHNWEIWFFEVSLIEIEFLKWW